jgi:hypothetical protein
MCLANLSSEVDEKDYQDFILIVDLINLQYNL